MSDTPLRSGACSLTADDIGPDHRNNAAGERTWDDATPLIREQAVAFAEVMGARQREADAATTTKKSTFR